MSLKITYPVSFTDKFYNRDTLRGRDLDANFNAVINELSNIDNTITVLNSDKYSFKQITSYQFIDDIFQCKTLDNANGFPISEVYNGLRLKGFFNIPKDFQSPRGCKIQIDNLPEYPLYIKNPTIPKQNTGLVIPKNGFSVGFMTFVFDSNLNGFLYEGDVPTGTILHAGYTNINNDSNTIKYQMNNSTGYLMLGGANPYWEDITEEDIEPFGYMLDNNNIPYNIARSAVGAGKSTDYTVEFGVSYDGLIIGTESIGSLSFNPVRYRYDEPDTSMSMLYKSTGDFSKIDNIISNAMANTEAGGETEIFTMDYNNGSDNTRISNKRMVGLIWLKI